MTSELWGGPVIRALQRPTHASLMGLLQTQLIMAAARREATEVLEETFELPQAEGPVSRLQGKLPQRRAPKRLCSVSHWPCSGPLGRQGMFKGFGQPN